MKTVLFFFLFSSILVSCAASKDGSADKKASETEVKKERKPAPANQSGSTLSPENL